MNCGQIYGLPWIKVSVTTKAMDYTLLLEEVGQYRRPLSIPLFPANHTDCLSFFSSSNTDFFIKKLFLQRSLCAAALFPPSSLLAGHDGLFRGILREPVLVIKNGNSSA